MLYKLFSLYSSTVERGTVNTLMNVRFILMALKRVGSMVERCATNTKTIGSIPIHVHI